MKFLLLRSQGFRISIGLIVFAVAWALFMGLAGRGGPAGSGTVEQQSPPTDLRAFIAGQKDFRSAHDSILLHAVRLERGPSDNVLFAVGRTGTRVLLILPRPLAFDSSSKKKFNVFGRLESSPTARELRRTWRLSRGDASVIASEGLYIQALSIFGAS